MEIFRITLINVAVTLLYILPGFLLAKCKKVSSTHLSSISSILVYVCMPLMIISSFINMNEYKNEDFIQMVIFFFVSLIIQIVFILIYFYIFRHKFNEAKYRLLTIGSVLGNVGFFGLPLIKSILSAYPIATCFSCVYVCSMNVLVFTIGVYFITQDKKYISVKSALFNPTTLGILLALPLYITNAKTYLSESIVKSIDLLGSMTTPLCMIILGIRLANVKLINLFTRPLIYLNILTKMVIYPICAFFIVYFIPSLSYEFKASILILSSVPTASMLLNLAEIHHEEEELSANIVLFTTLASIVTIPLVTLLLNI